MQRLRTAKANVAIVCAVDGVIDVRILQDRTVAVGIHSNGNGVDSVVVINSQQILVVKVILQLRVLEEKTCKLNAIA